MTGLIIFSILFLIVVVIIQWGKFSELAGRLQGEEAVERKGNNRTAFWLLIFMIVFLIMGTVSAYLYKNVMLGYGPLKAASAHGGSIDGLFNTTLVWTGIVFVFTHIALFWFAYKYKADPKRKAFYFPHNNTLEIFWTIVPLIVLTYLVVKGLAVWNDVMADVADEDEYIEIEATGYQFAWNIRYPGPDRLIGSKNYKLINTATNPLGQDWSDPKNFDDFNASDIVLPVNTKVRVSITARDVLHNFYLPHFRVKMDAIPGLPTHFIFTPIKTTEEYREELSKYPEWNMPAFPEDPESPTRWEIFDFELACAELCGKGHYSMRKTVKIVSQAEYNEWFANQPSSYMSTIRNTDEDPYKGQLIDLEIRERAGVLSGLMQSAIESKDDTSDDVIKLEHVFFSTGSAELTDESDYEIEHLASLLKKYSSIDVELSGHTDSTGDSAANKSLSESRASAVMNELIELGIPSNRMTYQGYGSSSPTDTNDTEEGRQNNRRTELKIVSI